MQIFINFISAYEIVFRFNLMQNPQFWPLFTANIPTFKKPPFAIIYVNYANYLINYALCMIK